MNHLPQKNGIVGIVGIVGLTEDWASILPITAPILPPFPTKVLPAWLRAYVEAQAAQTATPADLAAMLGLATCALCAAKVAVIEAGTNWLEPLNLFTVTSMPPGTRKSAVFAAMTWPVVEYERIANVAFEPVLAAANAAYKMCSARLERAQKEAVNANAEKRRQAEEQAKKLAEEYAAMKVPVALRLWADDCTPERVVGLLAEQGGRIAILSAEGGLFEMISGRYSEKGGNMDVYLKGHAGDNLRTDRMGRPSEFVSHATLTVGLAVQPEVLCGLNGKAGFRGKGLLGRFLYSLPESNLGYRPVDTPSIPGTIPAAYFAGINRLLELKPSPGTEGNDDSPHVLLMAPEARWLFRSYREEIEFKLRPTEELGDMTDWGGKHCGVIARIAGILHLVEHADPTRKISEETMQNAISLSPYLIAHARAAYGEMGMSEEVERCRAILDWIKRKEITRFRKREAQNAMQSRFPRSTDLDKPLEILCERHYIRLSEPEYKEDRGRKKGEIYEVNPDYNTYDTYNTRPSHPVVREIDEEGELV